MAGIGFKLENCGAFTKDTREEKIFIHSWHMMLNALPILLYCMLIATHFKGYNHKLELLLIIISNLLLFNLMYKKRLHQYYLRLADNIRGEGNLQSINFYKERLTNFIKVIINRMMIIQIVINVTVILLGVNIWHYELICSVTLMNLVYVFLGVLLVLNDDKGVKTITNTFAVLFFFINIILFFFHFNFELKYHLTLLYTAISFCLMVFRLLFYLKRLAYNIFCSQLYQK